MTLLVAVVFRPDTMLDNIDFDEVATQKTLNWTWDYLDNLDTSQYPFPNKIWHVKPFKEVIIKTTASMVAIAGILLNMVILTILVKNKWLWSTSNFLISNLALMDLLTLLFCPWLMLVKSFYQNYVLKSIGCHFDGFLQASLLLSSVGAVMLVSYDRLAAAALTSEARITKAVAPKLIIASWIAALLLSTPWILKRTYMERQWLNYLETYCVEDVAFLGIYWHFTLTLLVWIPLGLLVVTYASIMWRLEMSARELRSRGGGQSVSRARSRAMRITALVMLAAVVCRIPYTILVYWRDNMKVEINAVEGSYEVMWFAANYLMYLNCALNPLIYGFTNIRFRKAMDRTPFISWFKFGSWCCNFTMFNKKQMQPEGRNTEKIFIIENSPRPTKKLSQVVKHWFHINKDTIDLSVPRLDEVTAKPTKVTPLKTENI